MELATYLQMDFDDEEEGTSHESKEEFDYCDDVCLLSTSSRTRNLISEKEVVVFPSLCNITSVEEAHQCEPIAVQNLLQACAFTDSSEDFLVRSLRE